MEKNPLQIELERQLAAAPSEVIDLSDTSFHANGLRFPDRELRELIGGYLDDRSYSPDSKGAPAARLAISDHYAGAGIAVDPEKVFITASTSESYSLLFSSLAEAGDNVVLPRPTYPLFEYLAEFARLEARFYDMDFDRSFFLDASAVERQIDDRTRFVVLISPNNPTGRVAGPGEIGDLLAVCERHRTMLICDEVFSAFLYHGSPARREGSAMLPRPAALDSPVPVFTLNGVSKLFASPDLKLGWIAVTGDERLTSGPLERLEIANDTFLNCSSLSQHILPGLFARGRRFTEEMAARLAANRARLLAGLAVDGPAGAGGENAGLSPPRPLAGAAGLRVVAPEGGIHCVIGVPNRSCRFADDEAFAVALLRRKKLYIHPGYFYSIDEGEEELYVVVSFLKRPELLAEGISRLVSFL